MWSGSNLKNFLRGDQRTREFLETQSAWTEVQKYWTKSALKDADASDFSLAIVKQMLENCARRPASELLITLCVAIEGLLDWEAIGDIEAQWPVIQGDMSAAVEFRQMLHRRRRWSVDTETMRGNFSRIVRATFEPILSNLPDSCYEEWEDGGDPGFETLLIDLLDDPASTIESLFMLPYDDASFRLELFHRLRDLFAGNLLVASGFRRDTNIREVENKLVGPLKQKGKTGLELAQLYLDGSPFKALLDQPVPFRIPEGLRFEHCHIVGGTGHGKTQLMQKMIHADLKASLADGRSVIVIDSQGDLINKLLRLEFFDHNKVDTLAGRLVLVDPSDVEYPAALNLFDAHLDRLAEYSAADKERVLNGVVELYELFFGAFLGAELTQKQGVVFKYLARLMLAIPDATIHTLMQIMDDGRPFQKYMDQLDGSARYFFETEFFHPSFAATKKQVLRRLWGVLATPAFERMFTQTKNKLDLFEAMNEGKIILVSTAKDLLKREGSQLLGRFFIAMVMQAALERSTLSERLRNPAFVYVDEAQEYFDDSVETILNQARKYNVGLTLAHQTLDQLTPRLRSAILANTSLKCAGGVSAKDARTLADELRTTPEFIEGMKRRGPRTEFAVWAKHLTGQAIRLSVPLGFLESQPTLVEEDYQTLLSANRRRYCGTLADIPVLKPKRQRDEASDGGHEPETQTTSRQTANARESQAPAAEPEPPSGESANARSDEPSGEESGGAQKTDKRGQQFEDRPRPREPQVRPEAERAEFGKGGKQHRYLQSVVKELAEQCGFKATIEAPLPRSAGQVDVLIERDGVLAAIEISVTTPVEHECENLRKCLAADYPKIAVVLAKSRHAQTAYRNALRAIIAVKERDRVVFITPEEIPAFVAALAPPPSPSENIVKGYRVKSGFVRANPEDAKARQAALAKLIANSMKRA